MPSSWWTDDRTESLRKLWTGGYSFSAIASELGTTRCAVGGKIFRLDLSRNPSGIRVYRRKTQEQLDATRREKNERRKERRRGESNNQPITIRPKLTATNLEALRCVEVEPLGKTLLELGHNDCRYPFGDGPFTFCGRQAMEGSSYCGPHFGLSVRRGQT